MPGAALRGYGRAYLANGGAAWTRKEGRSKPGKGSVTDKALKQSAKTAKA